jgi:hypothetical protein
MHDLLPAPTAALTLWKKSTHYPLYRKLSGPQSLSIVEGRKISELARSETLIFCSSRTQCSQYTTYFNIKIL